MLSPMDDYPVHQIAEPIRHVATSDRNFYDRYYFNCYPTESPDVFLIVGLGQYPNLGVMDAFAVLRRGDDHIVARMSKALGADRTDTTVGPLRIEVLEGLQKLRVVLEPGSEYDLSFDITFDATIPAALEPKHFRRQLERVTFDTSRFLQTGTWTGSLTVDGEEFAIDPKTWRGNRDRSWGVRPVGEAEPQGRRAVDGIQNFFWIYAVMQFDEFTISVIMQEDEQGRRIVEEAMRVWPDETRDNEWLGRPEHELTFCPDTRDVTGATITFHRPGGEVLTVTCELLLANYIGIGTGYGLEQDWRHGMWQGELVVQGLRHKVHEIEPFQRMFSPVDNLASFTLTEGANTHTGTGLFEVAAIGPHEKYGFTSFTDTAQADDAYALAATDNTEE
ncbi:hypothetical protein ACFQ6H_14605 [Rhodococcus sp. NPDC056506]|uniref:hypothetical protein n=1 Tax=unclassified Rhodococcus (in: high G+C Gram-positive bacteria) TaxID=192944 RepID=UPI003631BC20